MSDYDDRIRGMSVSGITRSFVRSALTDKEMHTEYFTEELRDDYASVPLLTTDRDKAVEALERALDMVKSAGENFKSIEGDCDEISIVSKVHARTSISPEAHFMRKWKQEIRDITSRLKRREQYELLKEEFG